MDHLRPPIFERAKFARFMVILGTRLGTDRKDGGRGRREHRGGKTQAGYFIWKGAFICFFCQGSCALGVTNPFLAFFYRSRNKEQQVRGRGVRISDQSDSPLALRTEPEPLSQVPGHRYEVRRIEILQQTT